MALIWNRTFSFAGNSSNAFWLKSLFDSSKASSFYQCRRHLMYDAIKFMAHSLRGLSVFFRFHSWHVDVGKRKMEINKIPAVHRQSPKIISRFSLFCYCGGKAFKIYTFFLDGGRLKELFRFRLWIQPEIEGKLLKIACHCVGCFPDSSASWSLFPQLLLKHRREIVVGVKKVFTRNLNKRLVNNPELAKIFFSPFF